MRIAVASGKGGTGKTTVAVNLAVLRAESASDRTLLLDCDVEAPNTHLYLAPSIEERRPVHQRAPEVDEAGCTGCGLCARACQFGALIEVGTTPGVAGAPIMVLPELCHGCGACTLACRNGAIREVAREVGTLLLGRAGRLLYGQGILRVGEAMATPVVRRLKEYADAAPFVVLDAPPGTACPMVETVRGADFCVLVTEPTPFGLHDLRAAVAVTRALGVPAGVVINRDGIGDERVARWCAGAGLPVLARIAYDRRVAELCAEGKPLVRVSSEHARLFRRLLDRIVALAPPVPGTAAALPARSA